MPEVIQGIVRSDQTLQSGKPISMDPVLHKLNPDSAIFHTRLMKAAEGKVESVTRMEHKWRDRNILPGSSTVTAAAAAADTTVQVANPEYFHKDQWLAAKLSDGSIVRFKMAENVGGTTAAGKLTIVNQTGSGGLSAGLPVGTLIVRLPMAQIDGGALPPSYASKAVEHSTYPMFINEMRGVTTIEDGEATYGGEKELDISTQEMVIDVHRSINLAMYLGKSGVEVISGSGARRWFMAGLSDYLASYTTDFNGKAFTAAAVGLVLRPTRFFGASSPMKTLIAGQNAVAAMSTWAEGSVRITPGVDQTWGYTFNRVFGPFGDLEVLYDINLCQENGLQDLAMIVDTAFLRLIQFHTLPLALRRNVQDNTDVNNLKNAYIGTRGFKLIHPSLHRWIFNVGQ